MQLFLRWRQKFAELVETTGVNNTKFQLVPWKYNAHVLFQIIQRAFYFVNEKTFYITCIRKKINRSRNGCRRSSSIFELKYRLLLLTVSFTIGSHCKGLELVTPRYTFFLLAVALLLDKKIRQSAAQVVSFCETSNRPLNIKNVPSCTLPIF